MLTADVSAGCTSQLNPAELPQFLYDHGLCKDGAVAVTQPRRVATVTVARRVAEEMGVELGETVG